MSDLHVVGGPPPIDDGDIIRCPKCRADLTDEYIPGYGMSYGGGLGKYWYCTSDDCDWFYKELDEDEQ